MNAFWSSLQNWYQRVINSIALLPAVIAVTCFFLAFAIIMIEYESFTLDLKERISYLLITNREEARLVLGTLVASIISLMVFSFSMVMVVLSRASSDLSPRVLPGLISNKTHQFILGLYLGTIIYTLILITNFQKDGDHRIPSLGVLIAMVLGIACLWLFIYFIHSISQNIQVENILEQIFSKTLKALRIGREGGREYAFASEDFTQSVCTDKPGYIVRCNTDSLVSIARKNKIQIRIMRNAAFFFVTGYPFVKIKAEEQVDAETIKAIKQCFLFALSDQLSDHYYYGFRQISEIATKALSPGINDPGTALKALDHLLLLLIEKMEVADPLTIRDSDGTVRLIHAPVTFEELVFRNLIPIREFGKGDVLVQLKLLAIMKNLLVCDKDRNHSKVIATFLRSCLESANENVRNSLDRDQINEIVITLNQNLPDSLTLDPLPPPS